MPSTKGKIPVPPSAGYGLSYALYGLSNVPAATRIENDVPRRWIVTSKKKPKTQSEHEPEPEHIPVAPVEEPQLIPEPSDDEFIEEQNKAVQEAKCRIETKKLRGRLPKFLQQYAEAISVAVPLEEIRVVRDNGADGGRLKIFSTTLCLRIHPPGNNPIDKVLTITTDKWVAETKSSGCRQVEIVLEYKDERNVERAEAYVKLYKNEDSARDVHMRMAEGMKEMMFDVVENMGYDIENGGKMDVDAVIQLLYILTDGTGVLDHEVEVGSESLHDIIERNVRVGCPEETAT